jgi:hypothetical protein
MQPRGHENLQPQFAAAQRHFQHLARRLADGPDHPEIANGGAAGFRAALENFDSMSFACRDVSMSQTQNSRANNCDLHNRTLGLTWWLRVLEGDGERAQAQEALPDWLAQKSIRSDI